MTGRNWLFIAAAALPCAVLLVFFGTGLREWWLISSGQISVIPTPKPGDTSAIGVSASSLLPLIAGSGALAAVFGYALLRRSRKVLAGGYAAVAAIAALAYASRADASKEGAGIAEAVAFLVLATLAWLVACMAWGAIQGARKARQEGTSMPGGIGRGLLSGISTFIIMLAICWVIATIGGGVFMVYALLTGQ